MVEKVIYKEGEYSHPDVGKYIFPKVGDIVRLDHSGVNPRVMVVHNPGDTGKCGRVLSVNRYFELASIKLEDGTITPWVTPSLTIIK